MDNNYRLVLFLILSLVILGVSQFFFPPPPAPPQTAAGGPNAVSQAGSTASPATGASNPPASVAKAAAPRKAVHVAAASVTIDTDDYTAVFSNQGAVLTGFQLKKYLNRETHQPIELVNPDPARPKPFSLSYDPIPDLNQQAFEVEGSSKKLSKSEPKAELTFRYVGEDGRTLEKHFGFENGEYRIDFDVTVGQTGHGSTSSSNLVVEWPDTLGPDENTGVKYRGGQAAYHVTIQSANGTDHERPKSSQEITETSNILWTGLANQFFTAVFIPDPGTGAASAKVVRDFHAYQVPTTENPSTENPKLFTPRPELVFAGPALKAGESFNRKVQVYFGPQEYDRLQKLNLAPVMDLGTFGFISVYMMDLLRWFFTLAKNWGLAVILLSILVKLVLWLPTHNSYKNMYMTQQKMREIQPKMDALKRKYPNDPTKQREEQARLFQEAGVNPLGGCLPMFFQMPVFWALYAALNHSIELRGAGFLWLKDLTLYDPIYVLPLLMGGTMILQQKVSGQMATQATGQQKMMMWMMPVVLTFISTKWPAGLLLYWVVTNVLSMVQQKVVNREIQHTKKKVEEGKP